MMSRSRRRFLFDNIREINVLQGAIGKTFNFGSVIPMTGTGLGIQESTTGVAAGGSIGPQADENDSAAEKAGKGVMRAFLALLMFQRTKRSISQNPKHCFFGVRDPYGLEKEINEAAGAVKEQAADRQAEKIAEALKASE